MNPTYLHENMHIAYRHPSVSEDYYMELRSRCLFWHSVECGKLVRCGNDNPRGRGHRRSLTLACLHGLQRFYSFSFPSAAERASLQSWRDHSAQSVSRLTVWGLLLPSCSGRCPRLLGPSCTHLWIAAVVCLWDVFPARVLHRGGLWGSVRRPSARRGRASAYVSVSAVWTCWCIQLCPGQCCLGPCPARWCSECVGGWSESWAAVGPQLSGLLLLHRLRRGSHAGTAAGL